MPDKQRVGLEKSPEFIKWEVVIDREGLEVEKQIKMVIELRKELKSRLF